MEDLAVMDVLHGETDLGEPLDDLAFIHVAAPPLLQLLLDISTLSESSLPSAKSMTMQSLPRLVV